MNGKYVLVLLFSLAITVFSMAATCSEWNKTFGGVHHDYGYAVQQTSDGGYVIVGSKYAPSQDAWLIKTDSSGNTIWDRTFSGTLGPSADVGYAVQQTSDDGYVIAGKTGVDGSSKAWLLKTDSSGNMIWDRTFGGASADSASSVQQTSDGGYIIGGTTHSYGAGNSDAWLIKTDSSGNMIWDKTFGGTDYDYAVSVQQTNDGGYVIAGKTSSYGAGNSDAWLIKTDSSGNMIWDKTFGGDSYDSASSVQQTSDGGYIIAGDTQSYGPGKPAAWLIKTDSSGNMIWDKTFGGADSNYAKSVKQTSDGGYIIAGFTSSYSTALPPGFDVWLIKVDEFDQPDIKPLESPFECYRNLPSPELTLTGVEDYTVRGENYTRYRLSVTNWNVYPEELFEAAPDLPPCGLNTESSRTWVDIYDSNGKRLYGFCALESPAGLQNLWFAVKMGETPPKSVNVVLKDRRCNLDFASDQVTIP